MALEFGFDRGFRIPQRIQATMSAAATASGTDLDASGGAAHSTSPLLSSGSTPLAIVAIIAAVLVVVAIVVRRRRAHRLQQLDEPWRAPLVPNQWRYSADVQTVAENWPSARYCEDTFEAGGVEYDASLVV